MLKFLGENQNVQAMYFGANESGKSAFYEKNLRERKLIGLIGYFLLKIFGGTIKNNSLI